MFNEAVKGLIRVTASGQLPKNAQSLSEETRRDNIKMAIAEALRVCTHNQAYLPPRQNEIQDLHAKVK